MTMRVDNDEDAAEAAAERMHAKHGNESFQRPSEGIRIQFGSLRGPYPEWVTGPSINWRECPAPLRARKIRVCGGSRSHFGLLFFVVIGR